MLPSFLCMLFSIIFIQGQQIVFENSVCSDTDLGLLLLFFLIILFIFLIQDSLQADLEFKLQSIASYRKTDNIWSELCKWSLVWRDGNKILYYMAG